MTAVTTLNLKSRSELERMLANEKASLRDLAPYNGTVPGATAIARCRHNIEQIEKELSNR